MMPQSGTAASELDINIVAVQREAGALKSADVWLSTCLLEVLLECVKRSQ